MDVTKFPASVDGSLFEVRCASVIVASENARGLVRMWEIPVNQQTLDSIRPLANKSAGRWEYMPIRMEFSGKGRLFKTKPADYKPNDFTVLFGE